MNKILKLPVLLLAYFAFYSIIASGYSDIVYPTYAYFGFPFEPNDARLSVSVALLTILLVLSPKRLSKPSDAFIHLQIIFVMVPMLVLYHLGGVSEDYTFVAFISVLISTVIPKFKFKGVKLFFTKIRLKSLVIILIAITFVTIATVIGINGFSFNLNIYDVYNYRRAASASLPFLFAFLTPVVASVILPLLIAVSLEFKRPWLFLISVLLCLLMFATLHHKSYLFYPIPISGLFLLLRRKKPLLKLIMSVNLLLVLSVGCHYLFGVKFLADLLLRRMLVVPAFLNYTYFDFFSRNPMVYLSNSKLTLGLIDYPYNRSATSIIGGYLGDPDISANTGWLGTGYMHFGFAGLISFGVIVGILFKLLDFAARSNGNAPVTILIAYTPYFKLISSTDLPTAFLTHGLLYTLVFLFIVKFDGNLRASKSSEARRIGLPSKLIC